MTERSLDNIRIATKALTGAVVPLGVMILALLIFPFFKPKEPDYGIYPYEPSYLEIAFSVVAFMLLGLAFVLPAITVRRELQKRKVSTYLPN